MSAILVVLVNKTAAFLTASIMAVAGFFTPTSIIINSKPTEPNAVTNTPATTSTIELANALEQLQNRIRGIATTSSLAIPPKPTITVEIQPIIKTKPKPAVKIPAPSKKTIQTNPLALLSPDQLLGRTSYILHQNPDGTYWMGFSTNLSDWGLPDLKWDPAGQTVGGVNGMPTFNVAFDCNPPQNQSQFISSAASFNIRTPYVCTLSVANSAGQAAKKEFDFTTGIGFLTVSGARGSSNLLKSDLSTNNIAFTNTDDDPVTITGLSMDVSSTALNFGPGSSVKFKDYNDNVLDQYDLTSASQDQARQYGKKAQNINVPLSLTIPPHTSKVLFIEVGNISFLYVDSDPALALALSEITFDRSDMKISFLQNPIPIYWTCSAKYLQDEPDRMCH